MNCIKCHRKAGMTHFMGFDRIHTCSKQCLEGYLNERQSKTSRLAEQEQTARKEDGGNLGEAQKLHDLPEAGTQGSLWQLG